MAWFPIAHTVIQYDNLNSQLYSGAVLKAYEAGTTTPILMAIDSAGATTVGSIPLNASGYPSISGNVIIPYVEEKYKLALYPNQAAADANSGALWTVDEVPISGDFGSVTQNISTTTVLTSADNFNHIEASGTITITEPDIDVVGAGFVFTIRNAGTGVITIDGDGAETTNGDLLIFLYPGDFALVQSGTSSWAAGISRKKNVSITFGWHSTPENNQVPIDGSSIALTSGGTYNGVNYYDAYAYAWNKLADAQAAVAGGRGASAAVDFAANKKITLPDNRGRVPFGVKAASAITAPGALAGATAVVPTGSISINSITLTASQVPVLTYAVSLFGSAGGATGARIANATATNSAENASASAAITTNAGGSSFTPTGTATINSTSVIQESAGVYWYLTF